jgi:hypothetical protein
MLPHLVWCVCEEAEALQAGGSFAAHLGLVPAWPIHTAAGYCQITVSSTDYTDIDKVFIVESALTRDKLGPLPHVMPAGADCANHACRVVQQAVSDS